MLSQSQKKLIRSLRLKKYRELHGSYVVEGNKICKEMLISQLHRVKCICCTDDWYMTNEKLLEDTNEMVFNLTLTELGKLSNLKSPPEVIAVMNIPDPVSVEKFNFDSPMFYLDRIQDPGNLGTIIRISDWFGLQTLLLSDGCVDIYNPKVIQSAMASHGRVNMLKIDLREIKSANPDVTILSADMAGESINELSLPLNNSVIIIGNEGQGVDPNLSDYVDKIISIPGDKSLGAESLNAAITAGIIASKIT